MMARTSASCSRHQSADVSEALSESVSSRRSERPLASWSNIVEYHVVDHLCCLLCSLILFFHSNLDTLWFDSLLVGFYAHPCSLIYSVSTQISVFGLVSTWREMGVRCQFLMESLTTSHRNCLKFCNVFTYLIRDSSCLSI